MLILDQGTLPAEVRKVATKVDVARLGSHLFEERKICNCFGLRYRTEELAQDSGVTEFCSVTESNLTVEIVQEDKCPTYLAIIVIPKDLLAESGSVNPFGNFATGQQLNKLWVIAPEIM